MRRAVAALALTAALAGCTSGSPPQASPSPGPPAAQGTFDRYVGAYRTTNGVTFVVNGHGHLLNLHDSWFRQLSPGSTADAFTVGPAFGIPSPVEAEVRFAGGSIRADRMTITPAGGVATTAARLKFKETEVRVPAAGAVLAGTITEPVTRGPHPGIVIVHGSGPGPRIDYGIWVGLYASLGLTVLAYDKRGNGASTGQYPGELATDRNLGIYAADAATVLRFLTTWRGVDPKKVGFHAGSQGGWIAPLAVERYHAPAAFALVFSGPAVTADQQQVWADFSAGSTSLPTVSPAEMNTQVRAAPATGYVPSTVLATIQQPFIWFNGAVDRQVPTAVNAEILRTFHHPNWDIEVLPGVDHGLFENPSGLEPDEPNATHLAAGLWDRVAAWLAQTVGPTP